MQSAAQSAERRAQSAERKGKVQYPQSTVADVVRGPWAMGYERNCRTVEQSNSRTRMIITGMAGFTPHKVSRRNGTDGRGIEEEKERRSRLKTVRISKF